MDKTLRSHDPYLSRELLDRIRKILIELTHHPDPESKKEKESNFDPLTQSINAVRSMAMHGLINYSLYIVRQKENKAGTKSKKGFLEEEVQMVLDEKLDKSNDSSYAVHSVYGAYFPQLHFLNAKWTEENILRIFLPEEENIRYWKAAWDAYILWSGFNPKVFQLLLPQYRRGLCWFVNPEFEVEYFGTSPNERLAQHIMKAYLMDLTKFGNENEPLVLFFNSASDEIRSQAIFWLSQVLKDSKPKEDNPIWLKCWNLWQHRVESAEREEPSKNTLELSNYMRWLDYCPLGFDVLYQILYQSIKYFHINYHSIRLISYAAENCESYPLEAIKLLQETIKREKESWWRPNEEDEEKVLKSALQSEIPEAKKKAIEIINHRGENGDFKLKNLLDLV